MVKRTPSAKWANVYSYPTKKGIRWGAVADHGMVNGCRKRVRSDGYLKEKEARAWQIETLAAGPAERPTAGLTLGQWVDRWLSLRESSLAYGTVQGYRYALDLFAPIYGLPLDALTPADIALVLADLGRSHKAGTVRQARRVLSICCNAAVNMEVMSRNPVVRTTPPVASRERERVLTAEEVRALLSATQDDEEWGLPVRVLAECWLRIGELQGLQWGDIGLDSIRIERTASAASTGYTLSSVAKTAGSVREIPVSPSLMSAFMQHRIEDGLAPHPNRLVFPGDDGGPFNRGRLRRFLETGCKRAGVPVITPHGLRHAGASMTIAAGMDPKVVSERLGHSKVGFTLDRYVTTNAVQHRAAADLVSRLLSG